MIAELKKNKCSRESSHAPTPLSSPKKKLSRISSTRQALEEAKKSHINFGLLRFFDKYTPEEYHEQSRKSMEGHNEWMELEKKRKEVSTERDTAMTRELAAEHKRKS